MGKIDKISVNGAAYEIVPEIAPLFDTTTAYAAGDCVIKDAVLYRFTTAHAAGAWIGTDAEEVTVGKELTDLKADLSQLDEQMPMLITKTQLAPTEITQVADLANAVLDGSTTKYYYGVKVNVPWVGAYYMNPSNLNLRCYYFHFYNKKGEEITIYRNGISNTNFAMPSGGHFEKIDSKTIKSYAANGSLDWTWTSDDDIEYLYNGNRFSACIGDFSEASQLVGVTYYGASETYVPFVEPSDGDYVYGYADEMISGVRSELLTTYTDDEPTEDSSKFVKSGGILTYAFKDTYNLVDPEWFAWSDGATIGLQTGMRIPVTEGKYLLCNCEKVTYTFYDSSDTKIGDSISTSIKYKAVLVPTGAVKMYMSLNNSAGYIPDDHNVVVYYSEKESSPTDDRKPYLPHKNLQGIRGSNEIFDYYAPIALDKEILQMAKYSAVRNINFCNNTIRIGTFNMYNPRTTTGWALAKKMFADFAIDIVGFQEVSTGNGERVLTEFLKGWQFTDGRTDNPVAVASHFRILNYEVYTTSVTDRKWIKTVIQLPRYADVINPTLSIYDYHGIWNGGTPEKRAQEVAEILAVIAQDTSDFKIVVGDTNAQSPSEWDTWRNAGFTPVNDGNGTITTIDEYCLDNIFVPANASCVNWHVVPAEEYIIDGTDLPISDHDFVFADIKFDFDNLIRS